MSRRTSSFSRLHSPSLAALLLALGALAGGALSGCGAGAGGNAGGDSGGPGGTGTGGSGTGGGGPSACPEDCSANPAAPLCDPVSGQCVACLPGNDTCPQGQYCGVGNSCAFGCGDDTDCAPGLVCDPMSHQCVGCVGDSQCAAGTVCSDEGECVPGCSAAQPCPGSETCCNGGCVDLLSDLANCGACGMACADVPHAGEACDQGACVALACDPGFEDCNQSSADGCELDLASGACTCVPGTTQSCYNGPPGTEGVGSCAAGTSTCNASGTGWGICIGQVFPVFDECGDGMDNDCEGSVDNPPDQDGDGWSKCQGDCCDSMADGCNNPEVVNPGAIEVAGTMVDENCDGMVDNAPSACDAGLAIDSADPTHGAWAIELCKASSGPGDWGVVGASYVRANGAAIGSTQQRGLLSAFGPNVAPQDGQRMLVLSSGRARIPGQSGACGTQTCSGVGAGTAPVGFPQDVPNCPGALNINDDIGFEVTLRAPTNATGYRFNFKFNSFEYPEWVCTNFNDQFIALVNPAPVGSINGNISFDSMSNPVSVNVAFFQVCSGCPLGTAELVGTGFDTWNDAGATGWLQTTAPIGGGEQFTIRFATWDTGDSAYDSTTLIDNFEWIADGSTVVVDTEPEP